MAMIAEAKEALLPQMGTASEPMEGAAPTIVTQYVRQVLMLWNFDDYPLEDPPRTTPSCSFPAPHGQFGAPARSDAGSKFQSEASEDRTTLERLSPRS